MSTIYHVSDSTSTVSSVRLIRGKNKAAVRAYLLRPTQVRPATVSEVASLLTRPESIEIEDAGEEGEDAAA